MPRRISRRSFVQTTVAVGAGLSLGRCASLRAAGAMERLNVASVGCGGKGWSDLNGVAASPKVSIVALCNIDEGPKHLGQAAEKYAQAQRFTDWRNMLDAVKEIDAVIVSTPDHMHAPISLAALERGKHVFCQKPLTHTVFEARQMRRAAERAKVATQMGNQIQSNLEYRTAVALVHEGVIGKVEEVHSWQSGKMRWLLDKDRPAGADPVPPGVHWDQWLGVAPERPYKDNIYHPFSWRAWQDFGTGQLGDFACHILDPVFMACELTAPRSVRAEAPPVNHEVWNDHSTVSYEFPGTARTAGPTLRVTWYDGEGHKPAHEVLGIASDVKLPGAGSLLKGQQGSLLLPHVGMPQLLPADRFADLKLPDVGKRDHYVSWADACRGEGSPTSNFGYSGPLTEAVLLGTIAIRVPNETLAWDPAALRITNSSAANALLTKSYRNGWEPKWG
ncbi:MAG TPA: Gfo/Idh/MocA family oxidoreductase [Pirellulales bacterium]|jgi:predicted dehydrogenase|nr:Gfo/Idh/MocA family oxidoreductase [Pirellulales bacterium]